MAAGRKVFISYAHDDDARVRAEIDWLRDQGFDVWFDHRIEPGSEWSDAIADAIEQCDHFLIFLTPGSVQSEHCRRELGFAQEEGRPILGIRFADIDLPSGLRLRMNNRQLVDRGALSEGEYRSQVLQFLGEPVTEPAPGSARPKASGRRNMVLGGLGLLLLGVVGAWLLAKSDEPGGTHNPEELLSVVVLPVGGEPQLTQQLASDLLLALPHRPFCNLGLCGSLKVAPAPATVTGSPAQLATNLGLHYALSASLGRDGAARLHLVRASDGVQVWAGRYHLDRDADATVELMSYLARIEIWFDVLRRLGSDLPMFQRVDPTAVDAFLDANHNFVRITQGEPGNWRNIVADYERAVAIDPGFVAAYGYVANTMSQMHLRGHPLEETRPVAFDALERGLALRPDDPLLSFFQAQVRWFMQLNYRDAETVFRACIDDTSFENYWCYDHSARIAAREGRVADARRLFRDTEAVGLGPELADSHYIKAYTLAVLGDYEGAEAAARRGVNYAESGLTRAMGLFLTGVALHYQGDSAELRSRANDVWRLASDSRPELCAILLALVGDHEQARRRLAQYPFEKGNLAERAWVHVLLGDRQQSLNLLRDGVANNDPRLLDQFPMAAWWDPLRDDPQFQDIVRTLEAKITYTQTGAALRQGG